LQSFREYRRFQNTEQTPQIECDSLPLLRGAVTGEWSAYGVDTARSKAELLQRWDHSTEALNTLWSQLPAERFHETLTAFGMYTDKLTGLLLYVIDNEVHHRGQGYAYLRALGVAPPPFWERD